MEFDREYDARVRNAAFEWLAHEVSIHGDVLSRDRLASGFTFDQRQVPLVSPQGIFKPAVLAVPLSITTAPDGPYDDEMGYDGLLRYRYRGINPQHRDNVGLRFAIQGLHDQPIALPRRPADRPSVEFLSRRYERFLEVAGTV